ncbi:hypothetical protein [Salinivibrio sharmensis]|uniref:Uncharacterized protein n=1 Tax=Salinivibrio sharmensis TaxID=390883 RepID=A0ABX3KH61_9GAMM|nr:hypothetical protein [Salinivibrio sharmensis]OOE88516.1 hypothetical protein BZG74_07325 [Salinivibrio sharmensis]
MELGNFEVINNQGWFSFNSKRDLKVLGFKTQRLAKMDLEKTKIQVTLGSTELGQDLGLNSEIRTLIVAFFPEQEIEYIKTTNGQSSKPEYPSFSYTGVSDELNDFLLKLENLAHARAAKSYA